MLSVIVILIVVLAVSLYSHTHALGLWLLMMVMHNFIAHFIGSSAAHLPMYAGLIIVATIVARKKWTGLPINILLLMNLLFIVMVAAAIAGIDSERSLGQILLYSKAFVLAILIAGTIKSDKQVRFLTGYCLTGVVIAVGVTFFEYFTGAYLIESAEIEQAGRFTGNPNDTAMLLLIGIPLGLYWAIHSKRSFSRGANYVLMFLIVCAITFTQSRSGFVSLLFLLFFLYIRKPSIKASIIGLVLLGAALVFVVPPGSDYWKRMGTIVGLEEEQGESLYKRRHYVKTGMLIIIDNPVLGVGMGNFGKAMIQADPTFRETDEHRVAHNMYIEFFVENGIVGGLFFLTLLGVALIHALRYDKREQTSFSSYGLGFCVAMSLLTLLVYGLFNSHGKSSVMWFLLGLGFAFQVMGNSSVRSSIASPNAKLLVDH